MPWNYSTIFQDFFFKFVSWLAPFLHTYMHSLFFYIIFHICLLILKLYIYKGKHFVAYIHWNFYFILQYTFISSYIKLNLFFKVKFIAKEINFFCCFNKVDLKFSPYIKLKLSNTFLTIKMYSRYKYICLHLGTKTRQLYEIYRSIYTGKVPGNL